MSAVTAIRSFSFPASVRRIFIALGLVMLVPLLSACGFNTIPTNEEKPRLRGAKCRTSISAVPISFPTG